MNITIERISIVGLAIWILFLVNCRGEKVIKTPEKIIIEKVVDSFKVVVPKQTIKYVKGKTQYYSVEDTMFLMEQERKIQFYKKSSDSLQSKLYADAIELKDYSQTFNDSNITINVNGVNRGDILNMKADYTIKAKSIDLPYQKTFRYRILGGGEVGINKELNQGVIKANLMYQNKKSNITSLSYMKIGSQEFVTIGQNINLFTRNK